MSDHDVASVSPKADTVSGRADAIRTALDVGRSADYVKRPPEQVWIDAEAAIVALSTAAEFGARRLERIAMRIPPLPEMVSDPETMKYVAALRTIQRLALADSDRRSA